MEKRILKLLVVAIGLLALLVVALAILFGLALTRVDGSLRSMSGAADVVQAVHSLKVINGKDGIDGTPGIQGVAGVNGTAGKDSTSTIVIEQQPTKGDKGDAGAPALQVEFDGQGNWRYKGDDVWQPLFAPPVVVQ